MEMMYCYVVESLQIKSTSVTKPVIEGVFSSKKNAMKEVELLTKRRGITCRVVRCKPNNVGGDYTYNPAIPKEESIRVIQDWEVE